MARAARLTERNITRGQYWRTVPPRKRPPGEAGARLAHRVLRETWLTFAKGAAMVAIVLASLAYISNGTERVGMQSSRASPAQAGAARDAGGRLLCATGG